MKTKRIAWILLGILLVSTTMLSGCSQGNNYTPPRVAESSSVSTQQEDGPRHILNTEKDFEYEKRSNDQGNYMVITGGKNKVAFSSEVTEINVPYKIEGVTVKAVEDSAFTGYNVLTKVQLPDTVETIGQSAFENCNALQDVHFPSRLREIGRSAFMNCISLETISLPDNVTTIKETAFARCSSLTDVAMSKGITYFGTSVFDGTPIGDKKDEGAVYIDNVLYRYNFGPNTKQAIDKLAAQGGLKINDNVTIIAPMAFQGIEADQDGKIKRTDVQNLPILNLTLPSGLKFIGQDGFKALHLGSLEISSDVAQNSAMPFRNSVIEKMTIAPLTTSINDAFFPDIAIEYLELPSGIETIKSKILLHGRYNTVIFNEGIKNIGQAFEFESPEDAEYLKTVYIPSTATQIGEEGSPHDIFGSITVESVIKEKGSMHPELTIYTTKGSAAEEYAKIHNIRCKPVISAEGIEQAEDEPSFVAKQYAKAKQQISDIVEKKKQEASKRQEEENKKKSEQSKTEESSNNKKNDNSETSEVSQKSDTTENPDVSDIQTSEASVSETTENSGFGSMQFPSWTQTSQFSFPS